MNEDLSSAQQKRLAKLEKDYLGASERDECIGRAKLRKKINKFHVWKSRFGVCVRSPFHGFKGEMRRERRDEKKVKENLVSLRGRHKA